MNPKGIPVPANLILTRKLPPRAKLVWIALQLEEERTGEKGLALARHPALVVNHLSGRTGLSRPTVRKALKELGASGWLERFTQGADASSEDANRSSTVEVPGSMRATEPVGSGILHRTVSLPEHLITASNLLPVSKVLYGLLALFAQASNPREHHFRYTKLQKLTGWSIQRVHSAVRELTGSGWLQISQDHRLAPVRYTVTDPLLARSLRELEAMRRRLEKAKFRGEAIMREYLNLLVDSDQFEDDAAPGFLVNPLSGERLQFDRFYPPRVAFEFNGPQHYAPTALYSAQEVASQQARDFIKMGICSARGIVLRIVHPEDLSLTAMKEKIDTLLPLRDLRFEGPRIAHLESVARSYRRAARRGRFDVPAGVRPGSNRPIRPT